MVQDRRTDASTTENTQRDDDIDQVRILDPDPTEEERRVRRNKLDTRNRQPDKNERRHSRAPQVRAAVDLRPGRRRIRGAFNLEVLHDISDLRRHLDGIPVAALQRRERLPRRRLLPLDQQPARRLGEHTDARGQEHGDGNLARDGRFPLPIGGGGERSGGGADSGRDDGAERQADVVQAEEQAAFAREHALRAVDDARGVELADPDATDALADHVVDEVARCAEHACCADDAEHACGLHGSFAAERGAEEAGERAADRHEKEA